MCIAIVFPYAILGSLMIFVFTIYSTVLIILSLPFVLTYALYELYDEALREERSRVNNKDRALAKIDEII